MRKIAYIVAAIALLALSDLRVTTNGIRISKNIHEVDPHKFYRSAQLSKKEFEDVIAKYGIKTVINLQGYSPGQQWFEQEMLAMKDKNVAHIDIPMTTENIPTKDNLIKLLNAYKTAQRPILVHCHSGADRAGEASAIYAIEYMGESKDQALQMLGLKYLHVEMFAPSKRYFINLYEGEKWAEQSYDPCESRYKYSDRRHCPLTGQALVLQGSHSSGT